MKNHLIFILLLLFSTAILAQIPKNEIVGNYYLSGVREVGAGFEFKADNSFQFFFSYGALDRTGAGTWAIVGDSLVLNSDLKNVKDFELVKSDNRIMEGIGIKITAPNAYLTQLVYAQINGSQPQKADSDGMIYFGKGSVGNINLIFQFSPEKSSIFEVNSKSDNYFEFNMLQSVLDLAFHNYALKISPNKLSGKLFFLDDKEHDFLKEK